MIDKSGVGEVRGRCGGHGRAAEMTMTVDATGVAGERFG